MGYQAVDLVDSQDFLRRRFWNTAWAKRTSVLDSPRGIKRNVKCRSIPYRPMTTNVDISFMLSNVRLARKSDRWGLKIFNPYVRAQTFAVGSMHPTIINASRTNDLLSVKAMQGLGIRYSSWMRSRTDIQYKRSALVVRRCEFTIRHSTPTDKTQPPILNSRPKRWNNCPVS